MQYTDAVLHFAEQTLKADTVLRNLKVAIHRDRFPTSTCDWPRILLRDLNSTDTPGGCGHPVAGQVLLEVALELDTCETGAEFRQKKILDAVQATLVGVHSHSFFGEQLSITLRRNGRSGPGFTRTISNRQIRRTTPQYRAFTE